MRHATPAATDADEELRKDEAETDQHRLDEMVEKQDVAKRSGVLEEVENEKRAETEERREKKQAEDINNSKKEVRKPSQPAQ